MPKPHITTLFSLTFIGCLAGSGFAMANETTQVEPLHLGTMKPPANVEDVLRRATADFDAAIAGKCPIFAKFARDLPLTADGGSAPYRGQGYNMSIVKSLTNIGVSSSNPTGIAGFIYGPVLTFDKDIMFGNSSTIAQMHFYSVEEIKTLLSAREAECP
jgi:hypothetical protein